MSFDSFSVCVLPELKWIICRKRRTQMSVVFPCVILWSKYELELRVHRMSFLREQMRNSPATPFFLYCLVLKKASYSTVTSTNYWITSAPYSKNSNEQRLGNQLDVVQWHFCRQTHIYFFKIAWKLCLK